MRRTSKMLFGESSSCVYRRLLILVLLLFGIVQLNFAIKTVHRISDPFGVIMSPNYPNGYADNLDISWEISTKQGYKISLHFTVFEIEDSYEEDEGNCVYDFVEVIANNKVQKKFCGSSSEKLLYAPTIEKNILSGGNKIILRFVSDYSNEDKRIKGFVAHYKSVDRDECREKEIEVRNAFEDWDEIIYCNQKCNNIPGSYYCSCEEGFHLHENKHTCTSNCNGIELTEDNGRISTSNYPKAYSKLADCDWKIKGKEGISIDLRFVNTFSVERHYEEGCVYDWGQYKLADGTLSEKFCGQTKPNNGDWISTNSYEVTIFFVSDLTEEESGFQIEYKFNRVSCSKMPVAPKNGAIVDALKNMYEFEDVVEFTCTKGFRIVGSRSITCQNDGKWTDSEPTCEAIVCKHPKHIVEVPNLGAISMPQSFGYGAVITISCVKEWFEMTSGAASWICGDDAMWIPNSPVIAPNTKNNIPECTPACGLKGNARRLAIPRRVKRSSGDTGATGFDDGSRFYAAVVRGQSAKYGEWPWMAFVDLFDQGLSANEFCGGSLVSTKTVITAAHCTSRTLKDSINVYVGASERYGRDPFVQSFKVAELYEHKNYTALTFDNDIAVLILDKPVKIGKYARPVCLPRTVREQSLPELSLAHTPSFQKTGVIAGWGITETGSLPLDLNYARIPPIEQKTCSELFEKNKQDTHEGISITENMLCAGYPGKGKGRDSCQGDSGGPLIFKEPTRSKYFIHGIVSFGSTTKCGKGTFGIYTRVTKYIKWIDNYIVD